GVTVREALTFVSSSPKVLRRLQVLDEIGLGYLRLGQPATTLSGGEAQRVKIAAHLSSHGGERLLYVLDEPTTGLHFDDIAKLLAAFRKLLEAGHTLVVIENNLDVIKTADYIIDLGPEGGDAGGYVVATGTPEEIMRVAKSHTGRFLCEHLARSNGHLKNSERNHSNESEILQWGQCDDIREVFPPGTSSDTTRPGSPRSCVRPCSSRGSRLTLLLRTLDTSRVHMLSELR